MTGSDILLQFGETSLAVSILIVLVLLLRKPFAHWFGARAAYVLWLAPLVRLFLPELAILPPPVESAATPVAWTMDATSFIAAAPAQTGYDLWELAAAAALMLWATIAIAWFSLKLETQARFMKAKLANSAPASPALQQEAAHIARAIGLKKTPRIRVCEEDFGPAVMGVLRPVLFLPTSFESRYSAKERRLALAHEMAHVVRGDLLAQFAAMTLRAAQWPNPVAHVAIRAFRVDQEAACDAFVMARYEKDKDAAGDYAAAIVKAACGGAVAVHGLSLGHPVKERLMLLKSKKTPLRMLLGAASAAALVAGGLAATANYSYAAEKTANKADTKVEKKTISTVAVEADKGETLKIKGVKNAGKIEVKDVNGDRTVRIYDTKGKLVSENTYGPDDKMPYETIVVTDKDGKEQTVDLEPMDGAHSLSFIGENGKGATFIVKKGDDADYEFLSKDGEKMRVRVDSLIDEDSEFVAKDGERRVMKFTTMGGPGATFVGDCTGDEAKGGPVKLEWIGEDGDGADGTVTHQIICLTGDDAKPEHRAEALRKVISRMEEDAKQDAERRANLIKELREKLDAVEKEEKKK